MYYTYMVRCEDNSIYTGITTDLKRRLSEHQAKNEKSAKYTLNHTVLKFEAAWESETRSAASKLEYNLKKLRKVQKEDLIKNKNNLVLMLEDKLDCSEYKIVEI